ncbi:Uma2 family endonuclease [Aetokthonos hydrillicola Thurmond2011]|jgi:Uma2 family endonuclease|uniref:Uma2 family endonuclease n=1 Tax=Aetokthonos hydrillicola Thurmond2011 TaxID=2712845 RepID=A0AAP5IFC0_9CYAN|nr:Uma2 family endonuclease [Aetokthonos hydrillicola]MBO3459927.1 Uma2 family endonuclease [Aetokthonos hydrillicola CCALA 1050]MBW4584044.1 Uma2 family endonuclease [Aetokthonos hydrillicola CCALA 1050]MDR9900686.1 Uma2 family endonuclease [Aetokthonos hydrillicola Thurmond2011]
MILVTPKRFTLTEYHRLIELGFLTEDDRVELIRGELIQMAAKGTRHSVCNTKLSHELGRLITDRAVVRGQEPIVLSPDSEPEPDIAIASGQADDYLSAHPEPKNILLVIEVSDSTLSYDQSTKLSLYAEYGINDYWIINLLANQLECYSQPYQDAQEKFGYRLKQIKLRHESVILPHFPDLCLELDRIFPGLG